ncbi:minor capsid protein [Paenibacillus graminis]|uniref:minor capsid protein n=1 Tax=Paenibacillus graminis TaxID=189425 RepID=UPI002DBD9E42|nr:minor capsid protein [Paenibacillus graminis]MEC0167860.1 minor capsid protein [Paenibacillus graminis]
MALTLAEVNATVRLAIPGFNVVGNDFAAGNPDDCAYVRITGGGIPSEWSSVARPSFQVIIRSKSTATAEAKGNALITALHGKTEFVIGNTRVVKCLADQSAPWYLGPDENSRALYSVNFTLTTSL